MKIEVKVNNIHPKKLGVCAEVSCTFMEMIAVHNILVINGKNGLFVAMPSIENLTKSSGTVVEGKVRFHDIAHPVTSKVKKEIDRAVIKAYNAELDKLTEEVTKPTK